MKKDRIIRATAADGMIRCFAADTTNMIDDARKKHNLFPVAAASLGRLITGTVLMAVDLKGKKDVVSIQMDGKGPLGKLTVVARPDGRVKGFVDNGNVIIPLNSAGKLDVAKAVGTDGDMTVSKDFGLKRPYQGVIPIVSGEIAQDITNYMFVSEQKPSAVALGVLVDTDGSIKSAGGYILQPMPGADDNILISLEKKIAEMLSVSKMLADGMSPEDILNEIFKGYNVKFNETIFPEYKCDCSRGRLERVLLSIGEDELEKLLEEDGQAELTCHYCNTIYNFDKENLESLIRVAKLSKKIISDRQQKA